MTMKGVMLATTHESIDGHRLRVARLGEGRPLLLLHGYPDTLQIFSALAPRLAPSFDVRAFDWPGTGESDGWPGGATPFDLAKRIVRLLDHWRIRRATVVGHDMGGQAALALAATEPARVQSLVIMNSLVMPDEKTSWEINLLRRFKINRLLLRYFPRSVFRRSGVPRELDLDQQFARRAARDFIIRMCAGYEGTLHRLPPLYPKIPAPALILWGERDRHFPPRHGERLAALMPSATLRIIEGGEHWMAWSHAEEVAREIVRWAGASRPTR